MSYLKTCAVESCERSLKAAAHDLRKLKLESEEDVSQVLDVAVSVDAAWPKRYGFNSLNGAISVISIDTGCILDYIVKTKHCQEYKSNRSATKEWKKNTKQRVVSIMLEVLVQLRQTVLLKCHNLKYTTYVGDSDSSLLVCVSEALE